MKNIDIIENNPTSSDSTSMMRPIHCELDILSQSDGSALLTQGETAILSSVHGPVEVKLQNLHYDKASVEVFFRPKSGLPSVAERFKEQILRSTCESALISSLYPRTAISIQLQEMEDNGGLLACAINSACLAILNAGLAMKFVVAAVHCAIDDRTNELVLDPSNRHFRGSESSQRADFTFVFDSVKKNSVTVYTTGKFAKEEFDRALELCKEASDELFQFYRAAFMRFSRIL